MAFRSVATAQATAATSITCSRPSLVQTGDILVAVFYIAGNVITASSTEWTPINRRTRSNIQAYESEWRYVADINTEPASYTFTLSGSAVRVGVAIHAFSGRDSVAPILSETGAVTTGATSYPIAGVTTPNANNDMLAWIIFLHAGSNTSTPSAEYSDVVDDYVVQLGNANAGVIGTAYRNLATAGTYAATSWTTNNTVSGISGAITIAPSSSTSITVDTSGQSGGTSESIAIPIVGTAIAVASDGIASSIGQCAIAINGVGSSDGSSTTVGNPIIGATIDVSGSSDSIGTTGGIGAIALSLVAQSDGIATTLGDGSTANTIATSGSSDGVSVSSGIVAIALSAVGSSTGTSTTQGTAFTGNEITISGISNGIAGTSANSSIALNLLAESLGIAATQGAIAIAQNSQGISAGVGAEQGAIAILISASVLLEGLASTIGAIATVQAIAGISNGVGQSTGTIPGDSFISLSGFSNGFSLSGGGANLLFSLSGISAGVGETGRKSTEINKLPLQGLLLYSDRIEGFLSIS